MIARSGGWCEACPVLNRAGIVCADSSQPVRDQVFRAHLGRDKHEIKSRARGGSPTDPANCILVCRCAHDWIENHDREAVELGLSAHSWS